MRVRGRGRGGGFVVWQVLEQRGVLLRGLAHPALFDDSLGGGPKGGGARGGADDNFYRTFGAVPVGPLVNLSSCPFSSQMTLISAYAA